MSLGRRLRATALGPHDRQVFLHIGAMKTGTTYLQHLLDDNREQLASAGILWPGETWDQQTLAAMDVMSTTAGKGPPGPEARGMWDRIAGQMRDHVGPTSLFSMEWLSYADEQQARRIVESFPDHEVHVVVTVRDARYAVPAQWQTSCRMAGVVPFRRVITAMDRPTDAPKRGRAARLLQRTQSIPRMLAVWAPLVGPGRTHVVTVPPKGSDPTLLWRRFAQVLGIDPDLCAPPTSYIHTSLGHESTELLRLVNVALGPAARDPHVRQVKRVLVRHLLPHAEHETPIRMDRRGIRLSGRWNRQVREAIVASGAHVVGDLDDLRVGPPPDDAPSRLHEPSVPDLLEVAALARECLEGHRAALLAGEAHADGDDHDGADDDGPGDGDEPARGSSLLARAEAGGAAGLGAQDESLRRAVAEVADLLHECVAILDDPATSTHEQHDGRG